MSDDLVGLHLNLIRQRLEALQGNNTEAGQDIDAALEDLQVIFEEMQTHIEVAETLEEKLIQQNQQLVERYQHYYSLFQALPIAYLVTNANGLILEANQAIAQLLNIPQRYLPGRPLILYVAEDDRSGFRNRLNQLSQNSEPQIWSIRLCPWSGGPLEAELHLTPVCNAEDQTKTLHVAVFDTSQTQRAIAIPAPQNEPQEVQAAADLPIPQLPQSLDGLRVLVVDDEADVREFITVLLESRGIEVRVVSSAAAALEELKQFHPDVLLSDIRMPGNDGYSLIQQIRALKATREARIPAAAITAYLEEDREKALKAGFEAHLHKLAQPSEWIELVAQLAKRGRAG